jgi:predicted nuclease of predicted toxin-antitoxin system
MKILVDENIPRMTVDHLRDLSHDVLDIRGGANQGMADAALWEVAVREGRLLITTDKGFTEYRTVSHNGILIVRLRQPNRLKIHQSVMRALDQFAEAEWPGLIVVIRDATMSTSRAGGPVER